MLFVLLAAGIVLNVLFLWFAALEARGERHTILVVLGAVVLVEAVLAGPASTVSAGILRPEIAGQDFRPPDGVILAALAARTLSMKGGRISGPALLWAGFLAVYITAAPVGILNGFPVVEVLFQAKASFYLIGGMIIASGVDHKRLIESIGKMAMVGAAAVVLGIIVKLGGIRLAFSIPGQRFNRFGLLSNDSVTLMMMLGVVTLLAETTRQKPRRLNVLAGMILMLSPIAAEQRASYLVLAVCIAILLAFFASQTWKHRSKVTLVEIGLVFSALVAIAGLNFIFNDGSEIVAPIEDAFSGQAEQASAEARFSLADQALDRIQERPILGWGAGVKVVRPITRGNRDVGAAAHNLILDLGMRVGLIGLVLFICAAAASTMSAIRSWKFAESNAVAAVAAGALIAAAAVVTKGMVEPALEKFRLSVSLGIAIGLILACAKTLDADEVTPVAVRRPVVER